MTRVLSFRGRPKGRAKNLMRGQKRGAIPARRGMGEDVSRRKSARAGRFIRTAVCGQGQAIVKRFLACGSE